MRILGRALFAALLILGVVLTAGAVATGQAHGAIVGILPVLYGATPTFGAGVLLFALGGFGLLASAPEGRAGPHRSLPTSSGTPGAAQGPTTGTRGFLLVGPLPIWWGTGRPPSDRAVRWVVTAAMLAYVALIALFFFL